MKRILLSSILAFILSGCSGSTDDDSPTPPPDNNSDDRPIPTATLSNIRDITEPQDGIATTLVTVNLSGTYNETVTVNYKIESGSADSRDIQLVSSEALQIPANTRSATFELNVLGDAFDEEDETFRVSITEGTNVEIDNQFQDVTIIDSDPTPVVRFKENDNAFTLIAEGSGQLDIVLALDTLSQRTIQVPLVFSGIAAVSQDYELLHPEALLTFQPEVEEILLSLDFLTDDIPEGGESLIIDLQTPQNASLDENESRYRILIPGDAVLNDTGITQFYTDQGFSVTPDPSYPNQDAEYGNDAASPPTFDGHASFSFTKLDRDGNALPSSETDYRCVLDNNTGLVWEVKSPPQTLPPYAGTALRDHLNEVINAEDENGDPIPYPYTEAHRFYNASNFQYYYFQPNDNINGGSEGTPGPNFWIGRFPIDNNCAYPTQDMVNYLGGTARQCNTKVHSDAFNSLAICGFKDWSVPTIEQLRSLHSYQFNEENANYFSNAQVGNYLSSSPSADGTGAVWCLDTGDNSVKLCNKQLTNHLRLVRGGIQF